MAGTALRGSAVTPASFRDADAPARLEAHRTGCQGLRGPGPPGAPGTTTAQAPAPAVGKSPWLSRPPPAGGVATVPPAVTHPHPVTLGGSP
ncbi:hypothetical protein OG909_28750 [Streptomyces sp. NBC_01754]|uniref:hypothetical protein n=1 Tax=Streptomyces sp. NBC_01754 TaxID=2975930 RepID=UPI002DD93E4B|nr:hypothetical protein [Streptomyces sp. NBC_01754]WSC95956.1 hypothetical protein OG909_28750 [Streptomyces sp. NBC_01754]